MDIPQVQQHRKSISFDLKKSLALKHQFTSGDKDKNHDLCPDDTIQEENLPDTPLNRSELGLVRK